MKNQNDIVLITGPRCPACAVMKRNLKKAGVGMEYREVEVDSEEYRELPAPLKKSICGLPVLAILKGNKVMNTFTGSFSLEKIQEIQKLKKRDA